MPRFAPDLPDAVVGLAPALDRRLDGLDDDAPRALAQRVARAGVLVDAVDDRSQDVELALARRRALPTRTGRLPRSPERWSSSISVGELGPVDRVEDLEGASPVVSAPSAARSGLEHVAEEGQEVVGLGVESEGVQRPEREGRVADPGVAIVPVATAPEVFGQRRRRRGEQGAGRARR